LRRFRDNFSARINYSYPVGFDCVLMRASQCRGQSAQTAALAQFAFQRGQSVSEKFIVFLECVLNYNQVEGAESAEEKQRCRQGKEKDKLRRDRSRPGRPLKNCPHCSRMRGMRLSRWERAREEPALSFGSSVSQQRSFSHWEKVRMRVVFNRLLV